MGDLGKLIVAKGFKKLPKVQKIAQSRHTDPVSHENELEKHMRNKVSWKHFGHLY